MSFKYKVSVVIPVYNTEKYINEMLESLANQTLDSFEVILIDDGSTDKSSELINEYIKNNSANNMSYVYQDNAGPSVARNRGIEISQGEYICFADSDDKLHTNALKIMYDKATKNNADVVLGGTYKFNSETEWKINSHFFEEGFKDVKKFKQIFWSMGPCNKLYKKSLLEDVRFPIDLSYGEDQCFVMNVYLKAGKVYTIDELVYYYREQDVSEGSLTAQEVTNPNNVLRQVVTLWKKINEIVNKRISNHYDRGFIKEHYLNRLINVNIWNPLKNAIDTKKSSVQVEALTYIIDLINNIDVETFNQTFVLHRLCTAWIIDRYLSLSKKSRFLYMEIIKLLFKNLNNNAYMKIRKKYPILVPTLLNAARKDSVFIINKYLFKRKLKKSRKEYFEKLKVKLRNPVLRLGGSIRSIDNNKLILASNKGENLSGNLAFIEAEAKSMIPDLEVRYYGKKNRSLLETLQMYWDFSNAKNIVLDDYYNQLYNAKLNKGVNVIQVWHACGAFKKFGFSTSGYKDSNPIKFEEGAHLHYTHVIASSKEVVPHYAEAFRAKESSVKAIGVPRTDIFFDEEYKEYIKERMLEKYPILGNKKVIMYAPTFRGSASERKVFKIQLDFEYWCDNMPEDSLLVLKMHPSVAKKIVIPKEYSNKIIDLSKSESIEDLLIISDILISDYSSLIFEFALLNKPMIFFAYDLDDYLDERNFYYEYTSFVPGNIVKTTKEIVDTIKTENYSIERLESFREKFFDHFDGKSSKRFCEYFLKK